MTTDPRNIMNDQFVTPLSLTEREQLREAMGGIVSVFQIKGTDPPVALLALVNVMAHTLANMIPNKEDRRIRTQWLQSSLPLYVAAYEQKEKQVSG